jgi:ABC-type polysaccharide/polyol phosphate export permease
MASSIFAAARDLLRYRALLLHLASVQFRTRYQNALLGVGWSLATPLALFVVFSSLFQPIFGLDQPHYGLWLLAALFPWTFLQSSVSETIRVLQANATFIRAQRFPREVLPLAGVLVQLINLLLSLLIVVVYAAASGCLGWSACWLPLPLGLLLLLACGLCLLLSALDAVYKDVRYLVDLAMLAWFFLTPIFYAPNTLRERLANVGRDGGLELWLLQLNPMTSVVEMFRACLLQTPWPQYGLSTAMAVGLLLVGLSQFRRLVDKYVDVL